MVMASSPPTMKDFSLRDDNVLLSRMFCYLKHVGVPNILPSRSEAGDPGTHYFYCALSWQRFAKWDYRSSSDIARIPLSFNSAAVTPLPDIILPEKVPS